MGEGADPAIVQKTVALTNADPDVVQSLQALTFQMGPEQIVLIQRVVFQPELTTEAITKAISRLRYTLQAAEPTIRQVFIEPADGPHRA